MFELLLIACVSDEVCEYVRTPALYVTEQSCAGQAAIIAGMVHARHDIAGTLSYRYSCKLSEIAIQQIRIPRDGVRG